MIPRNKAGSIPVLLFLGSLSFPILALAKPDTPGHSGNATIRGKFGPSEIVITTTNRLAGAIHSLTWNGKEFIDSADHGRQLQSACALDCGDEKHFWPESYNPTEAGSRRDGAGDKSTSRLIHLKANGNQLETTIQMAYWLLPEEKSEGHPALNKEALSKYTVKKTVKIGHDGAPNILDYRVTFTVPSGERHTYAQFEALTGYMPAEFRKFWAFDPLKSALIPLDDGPGEQDKPVVLATETSSHAMGIISIDPPSSGFEKAGYGRFRFTQEKVVKWNSVFRIKDPRGIKPGEYSFHLLVLVGTRDDVTRSLQQVVKKQPK